MSLARPDRWLRLALITIVTSVLGGLFGYFLGELAIDSIMGWLSESAYYERYQTAQNWFSEYGIWAVLIAGFSPVPYKIFTLAAGASGMALLPFLLASIVARSARFLMVAGLMAWGGPAMEQTLHKYIERIGWVSVVLIVVAAVIYKA